MKIYTKTGDKGQTSLFGGKRVDKDDLRIELIGQLDELNAAIGLTLATGDPATGREILLRIQNQLFDFGAEVASYSGQSAKPITTQSVAWLEQMIDQISADLPPLTAFILPGGCELAARLQLARAICRRAERALTTLAKTADLNPQLAAYLNRLSDLLFTLARQANRVAKVADTVWQKD